MLTGDGRSIYSRAADGLNLGFFVVGKHGYRLALGLTLFAEQLNLLVDTQDSGHFGIKVRIPFFHVIAHLVGFERLCREYLRDCAAADFRQTRMPGPPAVAADMLGQKMGGPQFLRITELFGLAAGQRH